MLCLPEPLHFDEVADDLQQHWEATQAAHASAPSSPDLLQADADTAAPSNNLGQQGMLAASQTQGVIPGSNFMHMQPFSDAGRACQSEQVYTCCAPASL